MPLGPEATLIDVMFAVATVLDAIGGRALLVGGGAATYYAPEAYQSQDCDLIRQFNANPVAVREAIGSIGFRRSPEGMFQHDQIRYTVEFPKGPPYIGIDHIEHDATERRRDEVLHLFTPTDVVRDCFMHFWAWGDYTALRAGLDVAKARPAEVQFDVIADWTEREMRNAPGAYDTTRCRLMLRDPADILIRA